MNESGDFGGIGGAALMKQCWMWWNMKYIILDMVEIRSYDRLSLKEEGTEIDSSSYVV